MTDDPSEAFAALLGSLANLFETRADLARHEARARAGDEIAQRFLSRCQTYVEAAREVRDLQRQIRNSN